MKRVYQYLIPAAVALALVFSLGFFFGRRSVPYAPSVDTERVDKAPEELPEPQPVQAEQTARQEPEKAGDAEIEDAPAGLVNINTATAQELMTLPGIGEVLAGRILEYRQTYGRFVTPEQLTDVSGIGEQRYAELEKLITVGE